MTFCSASLTFISFCSAMSNNPGQRSSSIYQQDKDAFSTHLDSSNAHHLPPHTKANGQVNRLSRVFDGGKDQYRPPPPPSKPHALRSSTTRKSGRNEEPSSSQEHFPSVRIQPADRPLSATSATTEESEPDQATDPPTMSFKDLQAKFQRAASTNETKSVSFSLCLSTSPIFAFGTYVFFSVPTPTPHSVCW